jgi:hypothetical protein
VIFHTAVTDGRHGYYYLLFLCFFGCTFWIFPHFFIFLLIIILYSIAMLEKIANLIFFICRKLFPDISNNACMITKKAARSPSSSPTCYWLQVRNLLFLETHPPVSKMLCATGSSHWRRWSSFERCLSKHALSSARIVIMHFW